MKKMMLALGLLAGLTSAGAASYVGISGGWPVSGAHYQTDTATGANRFTVGYGFYGGFEGSYEKLTNLAPNGVLQPYWGWGASLGLGLNTYSGMFGIGANGLVGASYPLSPELSVFGEVGAGAKYWIGTNTIHVSSLGLLPSFGGRLGINFRLN